MSFSAHKRDSLDATLPRSDRMSHLRSCALLVAEKYRVQRSLIIDRVRQICAVDITTLATDAEIPLAIRALTLMEDQGLHARPTSTAASHDVDPFNWLPPWHPIHDQATADALVRELRLELPERHLLHGIALNAVAQRQDCDDVLFELVDDSGRCAVVHLTYAQHPEPDPHWPSTVVYGSWIDFAENIMQKDAQGWSA